MPKLMMLVAAKWREFSEENPNLDRVITKEDDDYSECEPKSGRSRSIRTDKVIKCCRIVK